MINIHDYLEAGFRIFSLWGRNDDGSCECGEPGCKAILKHPRISNWQNVPNWSEEQIDTMEAIGHLDQFGVLLDDVIAIDIDERNGGFESYARMVKDTGIDFEELSGFVVATGGGGKHIYFKRPEGVALMAHIDKYKGIDFKSSGFLVGCGSPHASGSYYEKEKGNPCDLTDAPEALITLLKKPAHYRATYNGEARDVSEQEIGDMLEVISPDLTYDDWIKVGMAIHHTTKGAGYDLWDDWSNGGAKYPGRHVIDRHWHSFGKSHNPVTIGSLIALAEQHGWRRSVTFEVPEEQVHHAEKGKPLECDHPFNIDNVDLLRPPGYAGTITEWVNDQCRFPRERLAVAAAITALGNIIGLRHTDDKDGVSANLFAFCVADSATGKEAVQEAMAELMRAAGISGALHGGIKSEQEITRNLIRHQAAFYCIDELGFLLGKIANAGKSGASYLEGVIGLLMSAYGKANGHLLISGDAHEDMKNAILRDIANCKTKMSENEDPDGAYARKKERLEAILSEFSLGLKHPFLSMIGFTTPVTFDGLVTYEQATNGFVGRSLIVREPESNPKRKRGFTGKRKLDPYMAARIKQLHSPGEHNPDAAERVEYYGDKIRIPSEQKAKDMLDAVADWIEAYAEEQKGKTGLEAIVRRGYEMCAKISLILAAPEGLRTAEHVRWAYAMMRHDIDNKIMLAMENISSQSDRPDAMRDALRTRVLMKAGDDEGEPMSVIKQRASSKRFTKEDVEAMVAHLVELGEMEEIERTAPNGRTTTRYRAKR